MRFFVILIFLFIQTLTITTQNLEEPELKHNFPTNITEYNYTYHSIPMKQGNSITCWAYSAVSLLESEVFRMQRKRVNLSEMFIVYYEYIEKAEYFVKTKGKILIEENSMNNAVIRIIRNHGIVPYREYPGLTEGKEFNDHGKLFEEYKNYLDLVKKTGLWDQGIVIENVKFILNKHMGTPPENFTVDRNTYTPETYLSEYLKIRPNNYFNFMSTTEYYYNEKGALIDKGNWRNNNDFYNLNKNDFMYLFHKSIASGYTASLCGNYNQAEYDKFAEIVILTPFDISAANIDKDIIGKSIDNHCVHVVGYKEYNGNYWYLVKDSDNNAFAGNNKGYMFYHEDYISLKTTNYMIYVESAREILDEIIK